VKAKVAEILNRWPPAVWPSGSSAAQRRTPGTTALHLGLAQLSLQKRPE
jgi:hypothetical protein